MRVGTWITVPIGAALGGTLGELFGVRETIKITALGSLLPSLWLFAMVRRLREDLGGRTP